MFYLDWIPRITLEILRLKPKIYLDSIALKVMAGSDAWILQP